MNTQTKTQFTTCLYWTGPGTYIFQSAKGMKVWSKAKDGSNPIAGVNINSAEHARQMTNNVIVLSDN